MADPKLEVRGLRELALAFKRLDAELPKALRARFLSIASEVVAVARSRMPYVDGHAQESVKPRASARGAAIAFGGQVAPYMPWLDFGGSTGPGHVPGVPWSGQIKRAWMGRPVGEGRYVYPAIRQERPAIAEAAEDAVIEVARRQEFDTR